MGEALESRPWYRLHWITWVLLLLVGGSFFVENLVGRTFWTGDPYIANYDFGWPNNFMRRFAVDVDAKRTADINNTVSNRLPFYSIAAVSDEFKWVPLTLNALIALAIILATIFTTESYLRRQPRWQYDIQSIMLFTVFVAFLLTNAKYNLIRWHGDAPWEFIPFFFIAVGLWCVFWTGLRLIGWGVGRVSGGSEDG